MDLILVAWGFKTIHLLFLSPDCSRGVCTDIFFLKLGHNFSGICGPVAFQLLQYALPLTADAHIGSFSCRWVPEAVLGEKMAKS